MSAPSTKLKVSFSRLGYKMCYGIIWSHLYLPEMESPFFCKMKTFFVIKIGPHDYENFKNIFILFENDIGELYAKRSALLNACTEIYEYFSVSDIWRKDYDFIVVLETCLAIFEGRDKSAACCPLVPGSFRNTFFAYITREYKKLYWIVVL